MPCQLWYNYKVRTWIQRISFESLQVKWIATTVSLTSSHTGWLCVFAGLHDVALLHCVFSWRLSVTSEVCQDMVAKCPGSTLAPQTIHKSIHGGSLDLIIVNGIEWDMMITCGIIIMGYNGIYNHRVLDIMGFHLILWCLRVPKAANAAAEALTGIRAWCVLSPKEKPLKRAPATSRASKSRRPSLFQDSYQQRFLSGHKFSEQKYGFLFKYDPADIDHRSFD